MKGVFMGISESRIRRIIREEAHRLQEASLRGSDRRIPLFDEEQRALELVRELAGLYEDLQRSGRTESIMEMEDMRAQLREAFMSQRVEDGLYLVVGAAKAALQHGLRES
jgi:predicted transcriptional regulator